MANKYFGSTGFSGLNIKAGPHLIGDHELRVSKNGWTDEDGVWSVAKRPEKLYTGSSIVAFEAGRMDGADHLVWLDGSTLYDNGANVGTISDVGSDMIIKAIDDVFLIMGAAKNYIYDGNHVREQGAPQDIPTTTESQGVKTRYTSAGFFVRVDTTAASPIATIADATQANPCVIETSSSHLMETGTRVVISAVVGMTELNGNTYRITKVDATHFSLQDPDDGTNINSSGYTAYGSAGDVDIAQSGLVGDYTYYGVHTVTLSDGTVLSGQPTLLTGDDGNVTTDPIPTLQAQSLTLAATDALRYQFSWSATAFDISGTAGTDYYRGYKIYRTAANGYDVYLLKSGDERDSDCTAGSIGRTYDYVPDADLGAVLDYEFTEHINPPQSDVVAFAGQRMFVANGKYLHWSMFDGIEYYSSGGSTLMWDTITALGTYRDYCIVFSADRMWAVRIVSGVPDIEEIDTSVGTTYPNAMEQTDAGLAFLRTDGLYMFAGGRPEKISRMAFVDILSPKSVAQAGDLLYVSGSEEAYVMINRGDSWVWHQSDHYLPMASATSGTLYAASTTGVYQMFNGVRSSGKLKTKDFGGFEMTIATKLELDIDGDTIPTLLVNGNVTSDTDWHCDQTYDSFPARRVVWMHLPRIISNYVNIELEVTGDCRVYGIRGKHER